MKNELVKGSVKLAAALALVFTGAVAISTTADAGAAKSTLGVTVTVVNPCEINIAPDGSFIFFGCDDAVFDFSPFTIATEQTEAATTVSTVAADGVQFIEVTY